MARLERLSSLHRSTIALLLVAWLLFSARSLWSQDSPPAATSKPAQSPSENGFPVSNALVVSKCGGCHAADAKSNMSRISWIRTTPEGWEEAIKRMVRLHNVVLEPADARKILHYLSDEQGLAPEEAKPVEYFPEHRMIDERVPSEAVTRSCVSCHALAKPLSWRRSSEDWKLLINTHIAFFSVGR